MIRFRVVAPARGPTQQNKMLINGGLTQSLEIDLYIKGGIAQGIAKEGMTESQEKKSCFVCLKGFVVV